MPNSSVLPSKREGKADGLGKMYLRKWKGKKRDEVKRCGTHHRDGNRLLQQKKDNSRGMLAEETKKVGRLEAPLECFQCS